VNVFCRKLAAASWYSYRAFGASDPRLEKIAASLAPKDAK
jgi:hypothetical protein